DWRPRRFNLANVLTRRPEGYHQELIEAARQRRIQIGDAPPGGDPKQTHAEGLRVKEGRLQGGLHHGWDRRASVLDPLPGPPPGLDAYSAARYPEVGDFVNQPYQFAVETLPPGPPILGGANNAGDSPQDWGAGGAALRLWREGHVWQGDHLRPLRI